MAGQALAGCRGVTGLDGKKIPLDRTMKVDPPHLQTWLFRAHPGERFRVEVWWPPGNLEVRYGSERLDDPNDNDDDEATDQASGLAAAAGPHHWIADWQLGPRANTAWFSVALHGGFGPDAIRVRLSRPRR